MAESSKRLKNKSGKTSFEVKPRKTKLGKTSFEVKSGKTMPGKTSFEVKSGKAKSGIVFQDFKEELLNEITVSFSEEMGVGGTARVYRGAQGNTIVATKAYDKTNMRVWESEKEAFEKLGQHPNIVTCFGSGETEDRLCIVMELIRTIKLKDAKWHAVLKVLQGVSLGLQHIHSLGLVHVDIKIDNILVDEEYHAQICDFGSTVHENGYRTATSTVFEDPTRGLKAYKAMDIYSFGMVILMMINDKHSVSDLSDAKTFRDKAYTKSHSSKIAMSRRLRNTGCCDDIAEKVTSLAMDCTETTPSKRPVIDKVVERLQELY